MKVNAMCISGKIGIPDVAVWSVTKTFILKSIQTILVQHFKDADKVVHKEFCIKIFHRIQDERFLDSVIFSDESMFHVSVKVNTHNCRVWGSENPSVLMENVHDSPKLNGFCALLLYGDDHYLYPDMLQQFLIPQSDKDFPGQWIGNKVLPVTLLYRERVVNDITCNKCTQ
jgi:hypothetical protein